jgi:hypothetical protein
LISLVVKEMQIRTTLRFHLTPVRMAIFKVNNSNTYWQGCGETGTLTPLLGGMQISIATMEISMETPQKAEDRTSI